MKSVTKKKIKEVESSFEKMRALIFFNSQYKKRNFFNKHIRIYNDFTQDPFLKFLNKFVPSSFIVHYNYLKIIYKRLHGYVSKQCIASAMDGDSNFNILFDSVEDIINEIQILFSIEVDGKLDCLFKKLICHEDVSYKILSYGPVRQHLVLLNSISYVFGIYATDLFSEDNCLFDIQNNNYIENKYLYYPYPTIKNLSQYFNLNSNKLDSCLRKKRFYKYICNVIDNINSNHTELSVANSVINDSFTKHFRARSFKSRRNGLWLWDQCHNPLMNTNISITKAIIELSKHELFKECTESSLRRTFFRDYEVAKKCIDTGEVQPIVGDKNRERTIK